MTTFMKVNRVALWHRNLHALIFLTVVYKHNRLVVTANIVENGRNLEKNVNRKKRKGTAFSGVQKQAKRGANTTLSRSLNCSELEESIGASIKKVKMPSSPNDSCSEPLESEGAMDVFQGQGYRLIDLERFSSMLSQGYVAL